MLTHKGTQIIKTERLTLRPYRISDVEMMYKNWANDPDVTKFLTWEPHQSPAATKELLEDWCKEYDSPTYYNWTIQLDDEIIGGISVVTYSERDESAEIGYCIGKRYWGNGIMTEAAKAVINYLFTEIGFNRIVIKHAVGNPRSGRVAQKCGLTLEGTMREAFKSQKGEFWDLKHYSILKREWKAE